MSVLERAKAHFDQQEIIEIEIPEWEDEQGNPTVIYSKPFTLGDRKKLYKFAKEDDMEFLVRLVIMKALDQAGSPVFDIGDKITLMNSVDPKIITRIANAMTSSKSVEEFEGN
jgi:hypothetical protein